MKLSLACTMLSPTASRLRLISLKPMVGSLRAASSMKLRNEDNYT